jgi:parallel beta-helix repeat protein
MKSIDRTDDVRNQRPSGRQRLTIGGECEGVMKSKHRTDNLRNQRLNGSPKTPLAATLFSFFMIVALHLDGGRLQAATVNIYPGNNIPNVVSSNPAGTTFVIYPGLYRLQTPIVPKDGDSFVGQTACTPPTIPCQAILNGAELLTSFQHSGLYYNVSGQTQQGQVTIPSSKCEPELPGYPTAYPGCIYPEDLYFDDVPLVHVTALTDVGPGKWFFDYTNHIIYFYDNPAGHTVETSVLPSAFAPGPANNVTIQDLTVEKFAAPVLKAAIAGTTGTGSLTTGANWVVQNNEIRLNHGNGVNINFGWRILNNYIHTNGNLGIGGGLGNTTLESGVLIQGNQLAFNNYAHVKPTYQGGGVKTAGSRGVMFRGNYSHDNEGSGFHSDVGTYDDLYENNIITHNTDQGIEHEISYNGTIRNNQLTGNGYIYPTGTNWLYGANLLSSTSQNDEAYCNTVEVSAQGGNGIDIVGQPRESSGYNTISQNNYFHHNTVLFDGASGWTGAARDSSTDICCIDFFDVNQFDYNTYHLPSLTRNALVWAGKYDTMAQFQAAGQDVHGSADTNYTGSVPTVKITSPADMSKVSGVVEVKGNAQDDLSKVEFYVDWKLQQTASTSPFSFAWDTSGVSTGKHTLAAMAYDTEGMSACYAVWLNVQ